MATRHIVAWAPYFSSTDEALDHFHASGKPVKVVLYRSVTGDVTGTVELEPPKEEEDDIQS